MRRSSFAVLLFALALSTACSSAQQTSQQDSIRVFDKALLADAQSAKVLKIKRTLIKKGINNCESWLKAYRAQSLPETTASFHKFKNYRVCAIAEFGALQGLALNEAIGSPRFEPQNLDFAAFTSSLGPRLPKKVPVYAKDLDLKWERIARNLFQLSGDAGWSYQFEILAESSEKVWIGFEDRALDGSYYSYEVLEVPQ